MSRPSLATPSSPCTATRTSSSASTAPTRASPRPRYATACRSAGRGVNLDLAELQGNILRGYGHAYPTVRHLVLRVVDAAAARRALGSMTDGHRSTPDVTAADRSPREAGYPWCLNIGFTWAGLRALGLPPRSLGSFPPEFRAGMGARAKRLGDVGTSAPGHWVAGLGDAEQVHALVTVHGHQRADVVGVSEQVVALE